MKSMLKVLCCTMIPAALLQADCNESCDFANTSKSFLSVRPQGQSNDPILVSAFRYDREDAKEDGRHGSIQFVAFGGKTTNDENLARYFSVFGKQKMTVRSSASVVDVGSAGDILADYFNVFTVNGEFESTISLRPQQSTFGFLFHGRKGFWQNEEAGRGFWGSISFPVTRIQNKLNFEENVTNDGGGVDLTESPAAVANMKEAFRQSAWNYGKIVCDSLTKTGVADVELKLGYEWLEHEPCHLESYIGVVIPTGNKPKGEYVFEPIVGNGKHFGVMWGGSAGMNFYEDEARDRVLRMEIVAHSQYLFSRQQVRSFDVKYKPWSRYMGVYSSLADATEAAGLSTAEFRANYQTPGINIFTRPVEVTPGFSHNVTSAVTYSCKKLYGEIGCNVFARQDECLELECSFPSDVAFKYPSGAGNTSIVRNITGNSTLDGTPAILLANYETAVVQQADLDLNSAASPGFMAYTLYGTIGYRCNDHKYPIVAALGGSYEGAVETNGAVDRWTVWGKLGFSF